MPSTVAAWSKACVVFDLPTTAIKGSNPTHSKDLHVAVLCVSIVVLCNQEPCERHACMDARLPV
jgi:hypothetical protein